MDWKMTIWKLWLSLEGIEERWLLISGVVCLLVSFLLGAYRTYCIRMQSRAPWNIPAPWHSRRFQVVSWFIVTLSALWFAVAASIQTYALAGDSAAKAALGLLIVLRWLSSKWAGVASAGRELRNFEAFGIDSEKTGFFPEEVPEPGNMAGPEEMMGFEKTAEPEEPENMPEPEKTIKKKPAKKKKKKGET